MAAVYMRRNETHVYTYVPGIIYTTGGMYHTPEYKIRRIRITSRPRVGAYFRCLHVLCCIGARYQVPGMMPQSYDLAASSTKDRKVEDDFCTANICMRYALFVE